MGLEYRGDLLIEDIPNNWNQIILHSSDPLFQIDGLLWTVLRDVAICAKEQFDLACENGTVKIVRVKQMKEYNHAALLAIVKLFFRRGLVLTHVE